MATNINLYPEVRKSGRKFEANEDTYKMASKPRGPCLIINNENFQKLEKRLGTAYDGTRLEHVFKELGFEVTLRNNLPVDMMKEELVSLAKMKNFISCDAAVVVILSHGGRGVVYGSDDQPLDIIDIVRILDNKNCPELGDKPKMIFLQACQGGLEDYGVRKDGAQEDSDWVQNRLPTASDTLISYATQDDYATLRKETEGGCYARCLAEFLSANACDSNLLEILQKVETKMRAMEESRGQLVQSTQIKQIGWGKTLYFNPGFPRELGDVATIEEERSNDRLEERDNTTSEEREFEEFQRRSGLIRGPGRSFGAPGGGGINVFQQTSGRDINNINQDFRGTSGKTVNITINKKRSSNKKS